MSEDMVKIKKESSHSAGLCCSDDGSYYPYGTSLHFDDDLIESLGVESLGVGDLVEVRGFAVVQSKSERQDTDSSEKSIGLQLTSVKLRRETSDHAEQLYGES